MSFVAKLRVRERAARRQAINWHGKNFVSLNTPQAACLPFVVRLKLA